jgi:TPP-dependent pyruvate/acetoin dehydrogenase alpha subunit
LKDVPKKLVKEEILAGRSMGMQFPKYRAYSSSIVGGCLPIAVGVAWAIKNQNKSNKVFVCLGDMAAMCGIATECFRYAVNFRLPIHFIVEDNIKSVGTPTHSAWCQNAIHTMDEWLTIAGQYWYEKYVTYYSYEMTRPHSGIGQFVSF